jgi:diguanylate cyclase (GGDEF)-like protein/PAS domain S-box-containing protein
LSQLEPALPLDLLTQVNLLVEERDRLEHSLQQSLRISHQLIHNQSLSEALLHNAPDSIIVLDSNGLVKSFNPAAEKIFGCLETDKVGQSIDDLFECPDAYSGTIVDYLLASSNNKRCQQPVMGVRHSGKTVPLHISMSAVTTRQHDSIIFEDQDAISFTREEGVANFDLYMCSIKDLSDEVSWSDQIQYQAKHDALTGLINRAEFEQALACALKSHHSHIMLYLDLDQFKVVNDTCGHNAGDELLRQISSRLSGLIREDDILARLGGDEFGLLVKKCGLNAGERVANEIISSVQNFRFGWEEKTFTIGVSIGLVQVNEHCTSSTAVLSLADSACYAAKDFGRNRVHVHDDSDETLLARQGEMNWVSRINEAVDDDLFVIYKQDIVPITVDEKDHTQHFEVLVRMKEPTGGIIPPGAFLPAAERYNLINNIDMCVVTALFEWLNDNKLQYSGNILCSVNLSGATVGDEQFIAFLIDAFERYQIAPHSICFEITETAAISNMESAIDFISLLHDHGCLFALDDFGSGLSSYAYLKQLPVDYLKIDGSFVKNIVNDPIDYAMVKSINEIGHVMGKKTIAEFVENDEILEKLREIGVDYAQGYGIARPESL